MKWEVENITMRASLKKHNIKVWSFEGREWHYRIKWTGGCEWITGGDLRSKTIPAVKKEAEKILREYEKEHA